MTSITVIRGAGDRRGADITDALITSTAVALARGRNELDARGGLQEVDLTIHFRAGVNDGQLIEVSDSLLGDVWRGVISSVEHRFDGNQALTLLRVERQ